MNHLLHRGHRPAAALLCSLLLLALAACGGGDGRGEDALGAPQPSQRCDGCVAGRLMGTVSIGQPLAAAALLRVVDGSGREASGSSDEAGRYDIDVSMLRGPLLLQALVQAGGQAQRLHGAALSGDAGQVPVNLTPLTELIVAEALGGHPADLLQAGRAELLRIDDALPGSESRIRALLQPVLDAAGVPASAGLRTTPLAGSGALQQVLAALQVLPVDGGYQLQHGSSAATALTLLHGRATEAAPLPAPTAGESAAWQAGQSALPALQQRLQQLAAALAGEAPETAQLLPFMAPGFLHAGLSAEAFAEQVLRRRDAPTQGGYSLRGVAFDQLRLLQVADGGDRLLLAYRVLPQAPQQAWDERMWFSRSAGTWQLAGDGAGARVRVRLAAVLGPRARPQVEVRSLPGAVCAVGSVVLADSTRERCAIEGGQPDVPAPGWLDLGSPADAGFGVHALYRSDAPTAAKRLAEHAAHSRLLGQPSAQVQQHLLLEVDAWQADPRARQVRVQGPGLPEAGLLLYRPAVGDGASAWTLDPEGGERWHGVRIGACTAELTDQACADAWRGLGTGTGYRFTLLDEAGAELDAPLARLAAAPMDATRLQQEPSRHFVRWNLGGQAANQPTLARLLGAQLQPGEGDALALSQPWLPAEDAQRQPLWVDLAWHRAPLPPSTGAPLALRQRVLLAAPAAGQAPLWQAALPARAGQRTVWLSVVITATDALGNRFVHAVSPDNPF